MKGVQDHLRELKEERRGIREVETKTESRTFSFGKSFSNSQSFGHLWAFLPPHPSFKQDKVAQHKCEDLLYHIRVGSSARTHIAVFTMINGT
jgi:hypothetical protein